MKKCISYLALLLMPFILFAEKPESKDSLSMEELLSTIDTLPYQKEGIVKLGEVASFKIPKGYKFLDGKSAEYVLHDLWGNPPSPSLGMILPADGSPYLGSWVIEITYEEDGHVKDDDAKDIKYDELLETMKKEAKEANPERKKQGYPTAELLGWASPPYYDQATHKLHWAKRLQFENDSLETLNYNIRALGRKGVLVLNAIGGMSDLEVIKTATPEVLANVNFENGNRYEDFSSSTDKVAAYGIGGLIAGGILAKTGLLAKIGLIFAKFAKVIILAIAGLGGVIMKFFRGNKENTTE